MEMRRQTTRLDAAVQSRVHASVLAADVLAVGVTPSDVQHLADSQVSPLAHRIVATAKTNSRGKEVAVEEREVYHVALCHVLQTFPGESFLRRLQ